MVRKGILHPFAPQSLALLVLVTSVCFADLPAYVSLINTRISVYRVEGSFIPQLPASTFLFVLVIMLRWSLSYRFFGRFPPPCDRPLPITDL